ncbi:hypothetical protein Lepto7375DRAFT_7356 [Leptolyngbya sp. PCC 7375]|nr:hypothetical protein Lepto7375DRAFT_0567 [Leptolyngbya sp. PCC 7375]EKU98095.1 hypothetical protein Lepto7375DRAFT_7356 [Leptolyngbya sp. PCC 7375]
MNEVEKILRLVQLFDEWLESASEEAIRQNCREQGNVFFLFLESRGIERRWTASLIRKATGYNAAHLWKVVDASVIKEALNSYYLSMQAVSLEEVEQGPSVPIGDIQRIVKGFWS